MRPLFFVSSLLLLSAAPVASVRAADGSPQAEAVESEEILIVARRSGAPIWEIPTDTGVLLLVGEIAEVPKATPWRPEGLEAATRRAQRVILGVKARVTFGDVFRILFRGGKLRNLPEGKTTADYLTPAQQARLTAMEARFDTSYADQSMLITAWSLLTRELKFNRDTGADATDIVRRAARKSDIAAAPVGTVRADDMLDSLFAAAPETHIACLTAAMDAVDAGAQIVIERGEAWTRADVPAVMASPIERATGQCWPWTDGRFGPELRQQWVDALGDAMTQPGVTLAVVPLRILAEGGGVLDQLEGRGASIRGPRWRARQASGTP